MAYSRQKALEKVVQDIPRDFAAPSNKISDYFEADCFGMDRMKELLSKEDYKAIEDAVKNGTKIDSVTANAVAVTVKNWAISRGATHQAHWFQPLTGAPAMKHDTFFQKYSGIEEFKGDTLTQQEPDASSFPNGGLRATHTARGYTAWDPTSPMFIYSDTLFIPSVFVSYTGDTLDYKSPLLKAQSAIDKAATAVCKLFDSSVEKVNSSLGCEQEYFLLDKAMYQCRPDLVMCGRTVFGAASPRGQQQDDHYFGSIPNRVLSFMKQFEKEALELGIPVTTRHNEVAPSQFEVAPIFEDVNIASDHNLLLMDVMDKIADEHGLKVLTHEKPFAGLNGSGKHNNMSLMTTNGRNLFKPSFSTRKDGLYTLAFLVTTLKAVHKYGDVLRASIAGAGNDHRLGANEAPPAIISAFLGSNLTKILDEFEKTGELPIVKKGHKDELDIEIERIPDLELDNTDRNRTSPFAFTGNKFEFRAVGSSQNTALPMTVLNTIVAEELTVFHDEVKTELKKGGKKEDVIASILQRYVKESNPVRFEGDGYSDEWVKEAEKRGLSNVKDSARAYEFFTVPKTVEMFERHRVMFKPEIEARCEVWWENYVMKLDIESKIAEEMALNQIIPASLEYQRKLIENATGLKELSVKDDSLKEVIQDISDKVSTIRKSVKEMAKERERLEELEDPQKMALGFADVIKGKYMEELREAVDGLEMIVDNELWPLPKYREILFLK